MGQKAITIYTPTSANAHIYAEDDAQIHRALFGSASGITLADNKLACSITSDNAVTLASGVFSNQGYMVAVVGGTTVELAVISGTAGAYRHDLLVAEFNRGGGDTADTHEFKIIKGTDAGTEAAAEDPTLTQNDLISGGNKRQEPLYRLYINGTTLAAVERIANYIGPVYQ